MFSKFQKQAKTFGIEPEVKQLIKSVQNASFETMGQAKRLTGFSYLLGINSSWKTEKGEKYGYLTGILYLAPHLNSGVNICPKATEECSKVCLFNSGRASMVSKGSKISMVNKSRFLKTVLYYINRSFFMDWLDAEIASAIRKTKRENMTLAIRLNGTSDIPIVMFKNSDGELLVEKYSHIQFYDYTKIPKKIKERRGFPNYDLTFSFGGFENIFDVFNAAKEGERIAVSFVGDFPKTFLDMEVINGDDSDLTFKAPKNVIYGLTPKLPKQKNLHAKILASDFFVTKERVKIIQNMFSNYLENSK